MTRNVTSTQQPTILMCPPDYFTVSYAINPWMSVDRPCDVGLAKQQWLTLRDTLREKAGADILEMPAVPDLPDLVFTANAAFVYQRLAVIARYKYPERQGEEPYAEAWFRENGYAVHTLPRHTPFEGAGDALIWKDETHEPRVFAGYRTRTDIAAHSLLSSQVGLPVLSLELVDPRFYHVDVCLCPLETGDLIYYPGAFDEYGRTVIEANVPAHRLIPVSAEDAAMFACNAVSVGDAVVLNQAATGLIELLKARGLRVFPVDLSEFIKAGGSAKCLTLRVA
ncbi:MAG: arginine deiminase-related protein [Candidatus Melainabacteria bacterium]|nr:arginine deiminase-related protein [Candidatus Melainabacteria bacterium]